MSFVVNPGDAKPIVMAINDEDKLRATWAESIDSETPMTYMAFRQTAVVSTLRKDGTNERQAEIDKYKKSIEDKSQSLENKSTRRDVVAATDRLFGRLHQSHLMNEKLILYSVAWKYQMKQALSRDKFDGSIANAFHDYQSNFAFVATVGKERKCTVTVSTTAGNGAIVRYAKAPDARAGRFKEMGLTMVVKDVEPANYLFQARRKNKQTGETQVIDCTGTTAIIIIEEDKP